MVNERDLYNLLRSSFCALANVDRYAYKYKYISIYIYITQTDLVSSHLHLSVLPPTSSSTIAIIYKLLYILPCQTIMQLSPVTGDGF